MKKKSIPKKLLNLMERREKTAWKLLELEAEVAQMLTELGVTNTMEYINYQNSYGVMSITEPSNYRDDVIEIIEKTLNS